MIKTIVVEDEPLVRRDLELLTPWEELGCFCTGSASNGNDAVKLFNQTLPDIVITDIRMPGMDGLEMIGIMAELCAVSGGERHCEFIILSGFSDFEYAQKAMRNGVMEYLVKPVDDDELAAAIVRAKKRVELTRNKTLISKNGSKIESESLLMLFREYELGQNNGATEKYVQKAIDLIKNRYISGITIEEASSVLGISAGHLSRIFKSETGYTFVDYLMYFRVKKAAELLKEGKVKVYEVADLVGYSDARYFSQIFRRITGLTPSEFRES